MTSASCPWHRMLRSAAAAPAARKLARFSLRAVDGALLNLAPRVRHSCAAPRYGPPAAQIARRAGPLSKLIASGFAGLKMKKGPLTHKHTRWACPSALQSERAAAAEKVAQLVQGPPGVKPRSTARACDIHKCRACSGQATGSRRTPALPCRARRASRPRSGGGRPKPAAAAPPKPAAKAAATRRTVAAMPPPLVPPGGVVARPAADALHVRLGPSGCRPGYVSAAPAKCAHRGVAPSHGRQPRPAPAALAK